MNCLLNRIFPQVFLNEEPPSLNKNDDFIFKKKIIIEVSPKDVFFQKEVFFKNESFIFER